LTTPSADRRAADLIDPDADYVLPDGRLLARGSTLLRVAAGEPAPEKIDADRWQSGNGVYLLDPDEVWTGAADMTSLANDDSTCGNWTTFAAIGSAGSLSLWNGEFWTQGLPVSCVRERRVYCVEM
jgi:hypothetical protein